MNTNTGGSNTVYNTSAGYTIGNAAGTAEGQVGGDYSSKAVGNHATSYTGSDVTGYVYLGAGFNIGVYQYTQP